MLPVACAFATFKVWKISTQFNISLLPWCQGAVRVAQASTAVWSNACICDALEVILKTGPYIIRINVPVE
jgi:hypothetical protein